MPDHLLPWLLSTHTLLSVAGLLVYALMSHALRQRRHPAAAVGWVLLLLSAPYLGIPLYLAFGSRKLPRARASSPGVDGAAAGTVNGAPAPGAIRGASGAGAGSAADSGWLHRLAPSMGLPPAAGYRALVLHVDGAHAARALGELIDGARVSLDVCTFLLGRDALGDALAERLARRAEAGVRVRLLVDGIGLLMGGRTNLEALAARGVQVARFVPPLRSPLKGRLNLRNHRKMAIADRERLWCGGRNLAAEYFGALPGWRASPAQAAGVAGNLLGRALGLALAGLRRGMGASAAPPHQLPWRDLSFELRGEVVPQAAALFDADWRFATEKVAGAPPLQVPLPQAAQPRPPVATWAGAQREVAALHGARAAQEEAGAVVEASLLETAGGPATPPVPGRTLPMAAAAATAGAAAAVLAQRAVLPVSSGAQAAQAVAAPAAAARVQLVPSGPDYAEDTLHALLVTACFRAQQRILAVTPYLVPDDALLSALVLAARRGVDVDIVLPASSNHRLADFARRRGMRELTAAGGRLHLVADMVHAKAVVFDDTLALAGSANLDARSLFLNYELMLAFDARADVRRFARAIESIGADATVWRPARLDPGLPRRLAEGLVLWLAFQL